MRENEFNWYADLGDGNYRNPILYTDYSDPDAIRVGDDYFMTASSFCNTPGLPILHSKDLVNWKVINYALTNIPFERYTTPQHGCGVWAPAIRYHEGEFIIFFPMPDEGIFVTKTKNPWGEWSKPHAIFEGKGWIDPCPFWDDDGRAYMVSAFAKSRIGFKSILHLTEMKPDCSALLDEGQHVFDGNENGQSTIEGPKLYKRNGYYYIMAPAGGVKLGWQVVMRSKNIWGPYEYKNVLVQGDTEVNGPHQGAWLDTQTGEDYFIHFQDVYAAGRIVHLQPVRWINDWPVMGEQISEDTGQPVMVHKKPDIGDKAIAMAEKFRHENGLADIYAPDASDSFTGEKLGLQWQWNANHSDDWYSMTGHGIGLYPVDKQQDTSIADVPNLLLQKWIAPEFTAVTELAADTVGEGDIAGMVSLGVDYGALALKRENGVLSMVAISGSQTFQNEKAYSKDKVVELVRLDKLSGGSASDSRKVFFRNRVELLPELEKNVARNMIYLDYSVDGVNYDNALAYEATAGRWVGVKNGIFCCHVIPDKADVKETLAAGAGLEAGNSKEHACFSYFRIEGKNTEK